jgi:DNA-binding transcriptional LysR family regulator
VFDEMKGLNRGRLNISVVSTANYFMPQLLAKFCQQHPKIQVSLRVANRKAVLKQLSDNVSDLAIMGQPADADELTAQSFMKNPLVVIAPPSHPLCRERLVTLGQLEQENFLLREQGSGTRSAMERFFAQHGIRLKTGMEMDTNEAIKQAVQAGMGLGILSLSSAELELETGRLALLNVEHFPVVRHWFIVHRQGKRLSTAAEAFKQFMLTEAERLAEPHFAPAPHNRKS